MTWQGKGTVGWFSAFFVQREETFLTSCWLFCTQSPFENWVSIERKEFVPKKPILSDREDAFWQGKQNICYQFISLAYVSINMKSKKRPLLCFCHLRSTKQTNQLACNKTENLLWSMLCICRLIRTLPGQMTHLRVQL